MISDLPLSKSDKGVWQRKSAKWIVSTTSYFHVSRFLLLRLQWEICPNKVVIFSEELNENKCNLLEQNVLLLHYFIKWMRKKLFCGYWFLFMVIWSTHLKYSISQIQDKLCRFGAWAKTKHDLDIGQHPVGISTSKHGKRVYLFPRIHEIEDQPGGRCRPFCNLSVAGTHTQTVLAFDWTVVDASTTWMVITLL